MRQYNPNRTKQATGERSWSEKAEIRRKAKVWYCSVLRSELHFTGIQPRSG